MKSPAPAQLIGLATAVNAVVVRPQSTIALDGAVPGDVTVGRGGMVCTTMAVARAIGAHVGGVIASGNDTAGASMRHIIEEEGIQAAYVMTAQTPVTVTIAEGTTRSSIMGIGGDREQHLTPEAVRMAWAELDLRPVWAYLTLPALDSQTGAQFVELARHAGASIAVTLSSANHVTQRAGTIVQLLDGADLVFGNADEGTALRSAGGTADIFIETSGESGAAIVVAGEKLEHVPVPADLSTAVVDTTGAGDAFAAGVLSTLNPLEMALPDMTVAVELAHRAAAVIISQMGATVGVEARSALAALGHRYDLVRVLRA